MLLKGKFMLWLPHGNDNILAYSILKVNRHYFGDYPQILGE